MEWSATAFVSDPPGFRLVQSSNGWSLYKDNGHEYASFIDCYPSLVIAKNVANAIYEASNAKQSQ